MNINMYEGEEDYEIFSVYWPHNLRAVKDDMLEQLYIHVHV